MGDEGSWNNYYLPDGTIEDVKLDTNVCTCIVYPSLERSHRRASAYTGAAVILAADAIAGDSGGSQPFGPPSPADPTPFDHVVPRHKPAAISGHDPPSR